ncbi:MAG: thiamine pyrophosphate-dependent enzyme, partial [Anaerolineae bacterium]|nr:thiamine pyrophosphate-dependent enzyme [Anaerolineae bacterium]
DLVELAERLGAPVTFGRNASGVFPSNHHLCAGAFNPYPNNPFPLELLEQSDLLLAMGMRGDTASAEMLLARAPAECIFLVPEGEDPLVQGASLTAAVDNKALLSLLKESIPSRKSGSSGWASQRMAEVKGLYRRGLEQQLESYRGHAPLHFGLALQALVPLLDHDALLVGDIGTHGVWASWFFELYGTQTYLEPGSWGAMGFALPAAIAGKLVDPQRQVVGITGDGAFLMSCSDFGTALELGTKIVLVVLNDRQYGMIYRLQTDDFGRTIGTELRPPDLVKFAESYGAVGIRVEDQGELEQAYRQALEADAPVIVDVVCGYGFPHPSPTDWLRGDVG